MTEICIECGKAASLSRPCGTCTAGEARQNGSRIRGAMENQDNIITTIRFLKPELTASEQQVADYILNNPDRVLDYSLAQFSASCEVGQATIIRFCRNIGCSGYSDFKQKLENIPPDYLVQTPSFSLNSSQSVADIESGISQLYKDTIRRVTELNPQENFEEASRRIASARHVYLFSIGDGLVPAQYVCYRFMRIGITCLFAQDSDMQLIEASSITADDVAIAVSHSGETRHVVTAMEAAHSAHAYTIGITQSSRSPMANLCDMLFYNSTSDFTIGKVLVAQRLAETYIFEILYAATAIKITEKAKRTLQYSSELLKSNKLS